MKNILLFAASIIVWAITYTIYFKVIEPAFFEEEIFVGHYYKMSNGQSEDPFEEPKKGIYIVIDKKNGYVKFKELRWGEGIYLSSKESTFAAITEPLIESNK